MSTRCVRCDRELDPDNEVWLELNASTLSLHGKEGEVPPKNSQGWFPFGRACANRAKRDGWK